MPLNSSEATVASDFSARFSPSAMKTRPPPHRGLHRSLLPMCLVHSVIATRCSQAPGIVPVSLHGCSGTHKGDPPTERGYFSSVQLAPSGHLPLAPLGTPPLIPYSDLLTLTTPLLPPFWPPHSELLTLTPHC